MPYIRKEKRLDLDALVEMIMNNCDNNPFDGRMNYMIMKIVKKHLDNYGESYTNYQRIIGELQCSQMEIFRRLLSKYEDKKIEENGDVE